MVKGISGAFGIQKDGIIKLAITDEYGEPVMLGVDMCCFLIECGIEKLNVVFDDLTIQQFCAIVPQDIKCQLADCVEDFYEDVEMTWGEMWEIDTPFMWTELGLYAVVDRGEISDEGKYEYGYVLNLDTHNIDFYYNSRLIGNADFDLITKYGFRYIIINESEIKIYTQKDAIDFIYTDNVISDRIVRETLIIMSD